MTIGTLNSVDCSICMPIHVFCKYKNLLPDGNKHTFSLIQLGPPSYNSELPAQINETFVS